MLLLFFYFFQRDSVSFHLHHLILIETDRLVLSVGPLPLWVDTNTVLLGFWLCNSFIVYSEHTV